MYSLKHFFIFGIMRSAISFTTILYVFSFNFDKNLFKDLLIVYIIWFLICAYDSFFDKLKVNNMPTPSVYNTRLPFVISSILSLLIIGSIGYSYFEF